MVILKVFNNNSVAAISNRGSDIILVGSGIGFHKKVGDQVDESKIERTYVFQDDQKTRFEKSLEKIPTVYFEIAEYIVSNASKKLHTEFSGEIFLAISDHISFAIKRKLEGIYLPNVLLNETKTLYKEEYAIGKWALYYIYKRTKVKLDEDEAGYIALHLVNFSLNADSHYTVKVLSLTKEVLEIIQKTMKITLDQDSFAYSRISTHLKYLGERVFKNNPIELKDTTSDIRTFFEDDVRMTLCMNRIVNHVRDKYGYILSPNEQTYLYLHIKRNLE